MAFKKTYEGYAATEDVEHYLTAGRGILGLIDFINYHFYDAEVDALANQAEEGDRVVPVRIAVEADDPVEKGDG